eukprot:Em0005g579a
MSEKNYVALELECLAIVFACQRLDQYIYGMRVRIETDHKPLEMIAKKSILVAPGRLQRLECCYSCSDMTWMWCMCRENYKWWLTCCLELQLNHPQERRGKNMTFCLENQEVESTKEREFVFVSDQKMEAIKKAALQDPEQCGLRRGLGQGWPSNISQVSLPLRPYRNVRDLLTVQDGVIYKGGQVVVPLELRGQILQRLHMSHQGTESTLRRARDSVYWPGMTEDVKRVCSQCTVCEMDSPALPKEKHLAHYIPQKPWVKVGIDLFRFKGKDFLLIVDYLTDYFEISALKSTIAIVVVDAIKEQFSRYGIPVTVQTDGGPQFIAREFREFAKGWEFQHTMSSPYNSQSNGKAESAVKIAKKLLRRSKDPFWALLEWHNTPTVGLDSSPSQRFLARRTRGAVPIATDKLVPKVQDDTWRKKVHQQEGIQDRTNSRRDHPPLQVGQPILVQDMLAKKTQWNRGMCVDKLSDKSYVVDVDGQVLRRNRRFLKQTYNWPPVETIEYDQGQDEDEVSEAK